MPDHRRLALYLHPDKTPRSLVVAAGGANPPITVEESAETVEVLRVAFTALSADKEKAGAEGEFVMTESEPMVDFLHGVDATIAAGKEVGEAGSETQSDCELGDGRR